MVLEFYIYILQPDHGIDAVHGQVKSFAVI